MIQRKNLILFFIYRLLDKHGAFNEGVIIKYSQQILVGLDYLHSLGILHRDLKGTYLSYVI